MKILVIQQKMIGDVLTSSILFEALRNEYPEARLEYLIYKHTAAVVENNPFIDEILLSGKEDFKPANFFKFLNKIKAREYDVIIDVYSKIGTAIICAYSGAGMTISYEKWYTRRFYSHAIKRAENATTPAGLAIENRLQLLIPVVEKTPLQIKPKIYLTPAEITAARQRLNDAGISEKKLLVMVSVLGSSEEKTYPHKYLATLLDKVVEETDAQLLFNYIPKQLPEAEKIYEYCSAETKKNIHLEIFGKSLREFMALTSHCDALIGNEGGAVNMAKALDIPIFAIFSPAVNKEDWSLYENDTTNLSLHLKDYRRELFQDKSVKDLKKDYVKLYEQFKPELLLQKLKDFLKYINTEKNKGN